MHLPFRPSKLSGAVAPAPPPPSGPPSIGAVMRLASYGDSRSDFKGGGTVGPDLNDPATAAPHQGNSISFCPSAACVPMFIDDCEYVANGGCSGEGSNGWNSGSRLGGRTMTAIAALNPHLATIQYGTNNLINGPGGAPGVTTSANSITVADLVITDLKALITDLLARGIKAVFETTMQRTIAGYANTATIERRDACDRINAQMIAWITAHAQYGTNLALSDIRSITQESGALTGAYLDPSVSTDGIHLHREGAMKVAKVTAAAIRTLYSSSGRQALIGATGPNLITAIDATTVLGITKTNCTAPTPTYGVDATGPYLEVLVTPTAANPQFNLQIHANVGSNGGATPANTVTAGQAIKGRVLVSIDDGSGGLPPVTNVYCYRYTSYVGGSPALQQCQNGAANVGTIAFSEVQDKGQYLTQPVNLSGGSSQIAAPSAGNGMRFQVGFYGSSATAPFRVRIHSAEMRAFS